MAPGPRRDNLFRERRLAAQALAQRAGSPRKVTSKEPDEGELPIVRENLPANGGRLDEGESPFAMYKVPHSPESLWILPCPAHILGVAKR